MAKCEVVGIKNFPNKDFIILHVVQDYIGDVNLVGKVAKEYKFVKKELLPKDMNVGDILNIDLQENCFGKNDVVGINILSKGGKA